MVQYSVGPIITRHGRITAREYMDRLGNHLHPMIQTLFPNKVAVFQDNSAPSHTAGTVQSWFEEHKGELQHLPWPAQSPDLNIIEPHWSVSETRVRNRFPTSSISKATWRCSLRGMKYNSTTDCSKLVQIRTKEGFWLYWRQKKRWSNTINKEMCAVSIVFPLFYSTPLCASVWIIYCCLYAVL
jgi:hypothetical protein